MHDYYIGKLNILLKKLNNPELNELMCRIADDFVRRSIIHDEEPANQEAKCIDFPMHNRET